MKQKITIGISDYSRNQIESGDFGNNCGWILGCSKSDFIDAIEKYEKQGYMIEFKTSLLRKIFCAGKYKIVASKIL